MKPPRKTKSGGRLLGKLLIAGFMASIVVIECAIAYFLIPDAEQVAALAERRIADRLPATLNPNGPDAEVDVRATVEVDLGQYNVTVAHSGSSTSMRVDLRLVGTVLEEDEKEVLELYDRNINRFRDHILYEIRNSEVADFGDPRFGLDQKAGFWRQVPLCSENHFSSRF